jgi:hypothetical protein
MAMAIHPEQFGRSNQAIEPVVDKVVMRPTAQPLKQQTRPVEQPTHPEASLAGSDGNGYFGYFPSAQRGGSPRMKGSCSLQPQNCRPPPPQRWNDTPRA